MDLDRRSIFEERAGQFQLEADKKRKRQNSLGLVRLLVFALLIIGNYVCIENDQQLLLIPVNLLGFFAFGFSVKKFNKAKREKELFQALVSINKEEVLRLELNLSSFYEGKEFLDPLHSYALDMDVFGRHSLYQLISRAELPEGRKAMASLLLTGVPHQELQDYQEAHKELAKAIDWRQEFQAQARMSDKTLATHGKFFEWLSEPSKVSKGSGIHLAAIAGAILTPVLFGCWFAAMLPGWTVFIGIALNSLLFRLGAKEVLAIKLSGKEKVKLLTTYRNVIHKAEQAPKAPEPLAEIHNTLHHDGKSVSSIIDQLFSTLGYIDYTNNALFGILANGLFNWDLLWLHRLASWKSSYARQCPVWFDSIGKLEAHASIGALAYAQVDWNFPAKNEAYGVKGQNVFHPLLKATTRVSNDFQVEGKSRLMILTGSNMSGKSTFLRTIGSNMVLAQMGAPVAASSFELSDLQLFSSMRTTDSLEESTSSFYAELKRLKQLLDLVDKQPNVFFMLDEILKGTNSVDRHAGAKSLGRQLIEQGQLGIISTHDLELTKLEEELPGKIDNYSFNSTIKQKEIIFDYKLTPGPCKSFNASQLMENMGIGVQN